MTKLKKRQSATLALLSALGPFQFDTYLPALPALMIFMATNDVMVQLTITASLLGMAAGQLFVGPITDNEGKEVVPAGQALSDAQILQMNYLVQGVLGRVTR